MVVSFLILDTSGFIGLCIKAIKMLKKKELEDYTKPVKKGFDSS